MKKAKRKVGRPKIDGLRRVSVTLTDREIATLERLGRGMGVVAGIRAAINFIKSHNQE